MTPFEILRNLLAIAGSVSTAYALSRWLGRSGKEDGGKDECCKDDKLKAFRDDAPIRVKGGSVTVKAKDTWAEDKDDKEYRPRKRPHFWEVVLKGMDPVIETTGELVEIEITGKVKGALTTATVVFKAKGSVRVIDANGLLELSPDDGDLVHPDEDAYMTWIKVDGKPLHKELYTSKQSETLDLELKPKTKKDD